ncbi:hypothetical protein D3C76_1057540 [compost metagenome]
MTANQPGGNLFAGRGGDHGGDVIVITIGFVDEALAVGQHADDARFAALDDVREVAMAAVLVGHFGDGGPGHRRGKIGSHHASGAFTQAQAIAAGTQGR